VSKKPKERERSVSQTRERIKLVIERTEDGYVAYPLGLKGVVVAQGDTYDEALKEVASAVRFHVETFGRAVLEEASEAKEVFTAETEVVVR
jgi:predicted RNase H-like HicB family nuclease